MANCPPTLTQGTVDIRGDLHALPQDPRTLGTPMAPTHLPQGTDTWPAQLEGDPWDSPPPSQGGGRPRAGALRGGGTGRRAVGTMASSRTLSSSVSPQSRAPTACATAAPSSFLWVLRVPVSHHRHPAGRTTTCVHRRVTPRHLAPPQQPARHLRAAPRPPVPPRHLHTPLSPRAPQCHPTATPPPACTPVPLRVPQCHPVPPTSPAPPMPTWP